MKRFIVQLLVLTTFAIPLSARTQPVLYLGSGVGIPIAPSNFESGCGPGPILTIGLGCRLSQAFEAAVMIEDHAFHVRTGTNIESGTVHITDIGLEGKLFLAERPHRLAPYVMAGASVSEDITSNAVMFDDYGREMGQHYMAGQTGAIYTIGMGLDLTYGSHVGSYIDARARYTSRGSELYSFASIRLGLKIHFGD